MAKLADAPDLGSGAFGVGVRVPSPAPLVNLDNYFGSCPFFVLCYNFHMEICVYYEKINEDSIRIKRVYASTPTIEIPEFIDGYIVREIGKLLLFLKRKSIYLILF